MLLESLDISFINLDWLILAFALLMVGIFAIYSFFLVYHALRYGEGIFSIFIALAVYFGVSVILLSSIFSSALLIS